MADDAVAVVRRMLAAMDPDDPRPDTALDLLHDDVAWTPTQDEPETATLHGKEAVMGLTLQWQSTFDDFRAEALEFIGGDDLAVVPMRLTGRAHGGGAEVAIEETWVFRVREGRVAEVHSYRTKAEGLEAAGL